MASSLTDFDIPIGEWVESGVVYIQLNFPGLLDGIAAVIGFVVEAFEDGLMLLPPLLLAAIIIGLAW